MIGPLDPQRSKVLTIPAGANFLGELARVLAEEANLKSQPDALADAIIYVPNRRSERALALALHQAAGGSACLLPNIRALGDLETDEPPPSAEAALADLPPILPSAQRIGDLTRLVMAYYAHTGIDMPAVSCLSAARELARLLDQAALSGEVDWSRMETLVTDAQLSEHWQQSIKFLSIITAQWPAHLEEKAAMDPYARRLAAAEAMAEHWQRHVPETPVIIAGSTGATPASRLLMKAALSLPRGRVILPGLDLDLDQTTLSHIETAPAHPQFAMVRALAGLDLKLSDVTSWPLQLAPAPSPDRQRLIHAAMAPAQSTADWTAKLNAIATDGDAKAFVQGALDGLTVVEAKDESEEAWLAAILLRETLEDPTQSAALVTPDAGLARQVSILLQRWDIDVAPSAGAPLAQSEAGSFLLLVSAWRRDPSHPVALMALLNHSAFHFGTNDVLWLDKAVLRGPRTWRTWDALVDRIEAQLVVSPPADGLDSIRALIRMLTDVVKASENCIQETISGEDWYTGISTIASDLAAAPFPWIGEDGSALSTLVRDLIDLSGSLGMQSSDVWHDLLHAEATLTTVRTGESHPRLAIWGPLEARLQTADRLILAGLNEDVWPAQPPADAFLPRRFRPELGMSDPDERVGLSAHDFTQLAAAPNVTLLSSQRREDKPAIASRWLWRLRTLARGALGAEAEIALAPPTEAHPKTWLTALETPAALDSSFSSEPRPCPPVSARPKRLSVTRIEQLVRDPYAIYCESVLKLRRLDRLNMPADARIRGTAVHKALERFELEGDGQSSEQLLQLLEAELRAGGEAEIDLIALRDRRRDVVADYLSWRQDTQQMRSGPPYTELKGEVPLKIGDTEFVLSATADRIELRADGSCTILDFKTGKPPTERQVRAGLSPQMPLQGLIAREGGFANLTSMPVSALTYLRFGTAFEVQELGAARQKLAAQPISDMIAEAEAGLIALLQTFANPDHPYLSAPRPERVAYASDYARLARRDEWTGLATHD